MWSDGRHNCSTPWSSASASTRTSTTCSRRRNALDLLAPHLRDLPNVRAEAYGGLTFDFVRKCGGHVLVRGIRDVGDLSSELFQANLNLTIGGVETIFLSRASSIF